MEQSAVENLINTATATLRANFDEELRVVRNEAKQQQQYLLEKLSNERVLNNELIKQLRETLIASFTEWISSIKKDISENTFAMGELTEKFKNFEESSNMNTNYDREISFTRTNAKGFELDSDQLMNIEERVKSLETQIDNIEDQSRRNNLKFYGVPDTGAWETWEQSEAHIRDILSEQMNVPNAANIAITRAHRLSKSTSNKNYKKQENEPRPIIVKFDIFKDRQAILMASNKLSETPFSISEDFCARTNKYRSDILKPKMDAARASGKYAVMRHRRLIIKDRIVKSTTENSDKPEQVQTDNLTKELNTPLVN